MIRRIRPCCWVVGIWISFHVIWGTLARAAEEFRSQESLSGATGVPPALEKFLQSEAVRADAQLNDVCFVDSQTGWAVGDRGTIWHTSDGGQHWQLQRPGVSARLLSVWFLDRQLGWAAGGMAEPYKGSSTGLVLMTEDGGRTWRPTAKLLLPTLQRIRMVDPQIGFAVGESSPIGPTGVWFTSDGGRSWTPLSGVQTAGWVGGDFLHPEAGALVGRLGSVGLVRRAELTPSRIPHLGRRTIWRVHLVRPVHGWLAGDGGLLMRTDDAGASWQTPPSLPPAELLRQFDLYALAVRGPKVWAAGSPGSRIFYSPDAGQTWQVFPTGQTLPIYGLCFPDEQCGWAVGALGAIWSTEDGGRTWRRQRSGGARAALLTIVGQTCRVPWEAVVQWAGQEGYLTYIYIVGSALASTQNGFPPPTEALLPDRLHEAAVSVGASGAQIGWRFPLGPEVVDRQGKHIVARWDQANDGRGLQALQAELVRQLRIWRPEVVLTHDASPRGDDPLGHLINQAVLQAVELAAEPTAHVDQLTQAGLSVWTAKRVFGLTPPGVEGDVQVARSSLVLRIGASVADGAEHARSLLAAQSPLVLATGTTEASSPSAGAALTPVIGFRLLRSRMPQETAAPRDFFERILLQPGGEARRWLPELEAETLANWQQQAQRRRHLEAIAQQGVQDERLAQSLLAQTQRWVEGLEPAAAAQLLFRLGQMFIERGQWPAAAEVLELLAQRQPDHPAAGAALIWLVQYYASAEAAWRVHGAQRRITPQLATPAWDLKLLEERWERAATLARTLEKYHPDLFARPELRFPLAVADRARGYPKNAQRWFFLQRRSLTHDAWWACAELEDWLDRAQGQPPKPLIFCIPAGAKPRLDGRLDEPFWRQAKPALLGPPRPQPLPSSGPTDQAEPPPAAPQDTPPLTVKKEPLPEGSPRPKANPPDASSEPAPASFPGAEVRLAYDTEYLYIGIRCPKAPGAAYPAPEGPRPRDPDLRDHDRVEIYLDLDRDWTSYWLLVVDHRGWTGEACWGDRSWNPQWFVVARTEGECWTVEAAIGLDQLTGFFPKANSVWGIGLQRIIPGIGIHTFPKSDAPPLRPQEFGLLIFQ